jgi:hypothetical protein
MGLVVVIGMFWSSAVIVEIKSFNLHHIDAVIKCKDGYVTPWRFLGIYGESRRKTDTLKGL